MDALGPALVYTTFLVMAAVLIPRDIHEHRLPDVIVLPGALALVGAVSIDGVLRGSGSDAGRAAAGGCVLFGCYLALRLLHRDGVGGGDVKLAIPVGVFLAWHGWLPLALGSALAFVGAALTALVLLLSGRISLETPMAFGPWMLVGAWAALLAS